MTERKPLSISVDMDTNKMQLKLRAIAKHTEALADELDAIDNAWQCDCGCTEYVVHEVLEKIQHQLCKCVKCGEKFVITPNDLSTDVEGS